jgi:Subtilisin-like serine proteases
LDIIGQEVKPINVGVLNSGSPSLDDPSFARSTFLPDWGWDMEDNDTDPMDEEFLLSDFSHGIHVGSTIAMLNDGLDGNGMGARITPIRVCYQGGCGNTYDAYLFVNGDANQSNTYFKERVGDNQGIPVSQVTEKLHSINMSYGGGGSQTSQACVKLAELSENGILVVSSSGNSGIGSIGYPSSCPTVYSIGATNGTDRRSSYSSTNQYIDFAAPGGEYSDWNADGVDDLVYAYAYWENYVMNSNGGNFMIGAQGTSMASPHAAGILGLIKYYYEEKAKPFQTNTSLPTVLKYTQSR